MGRREGRERARLALLEAREPRTTSARLGVLAGGDQATRRAVARHPNVSPETLLELFETMTEDALQNPSLPLLVLSGEWQWTQLRSGGLYTALKSWRCPPELLVFLSRREGWQWATEDEASLPDDAVRAALAQDAPLPVREGLLLGLGRSLPPAERHARIQALGTEACQLLLRAGLRPEPWILPPEPELTAAELEALSQLGPLAEWLLAKQPNCPAWWLEAQVLDPASQWQATAAHHPALQPAFLDSYLRTSTDQALFEVAQHPRCAEASLHALLDRRLRYPSMEYALAERGTGDLPLTVMRRLLETDQAELLQVMQRRTDLPEALRAEFELPQVR